MVRAFVRPSEVYSFSNATKMVGENAPLRRVCRRGKFCRAESLPCQKSMKKTTMRYYWVPITRYIQRDYQGEHMNRKKYCKRQQQVVIGVQLDLQTSGFTYEKWGSRQKCKSGDWLVNNNGDCYTISEESFAETYSQIAPGQFVKIAAVWASQAEASGKVKTNEGYTEYSAGDYIVCNNKDGTDSYAVLKLDFEKMYEEI